MDARDEFSASFHCQWRASCPRTGATVLPQCMYCEDETPLRCAARHSIGTTGPMPSCHQNDATFETCVCSSLIVVRVRWEDCVLEKETVRGRVERSSLNSGFACRNLFA